MNDIDKYKNFYKFTDTSDEIKKVANKLRDQLKNQKDEKEAIWSACDFIQSRARDRSVNPSVPKRAAKTLLASRFTKASDMIDTPISSCGALATLTASILRQMGYAVRLVHGDKPGADNHAWNEIWLSKQKRWQQFDCSSGSGNQYRVSKDCLRILDCADWSQIKDFLLKEHKKNLTKHNKLALS